MARILGIDYGGKRTGLSVTDPLQIIVSALDTVATENLHDYLKKYLAQEEVEKIVFGKPTHSDGTETALMKKINEFVKKLRIEFPLLSIDFIDESFTSVMAKEIIFQSGVKKSKRRDKSLVDRVSAVIILQKYLGHI